MHKVTRIQTAIYGRKPPHEVEIGQYATFEAASYAITSHNGQDTFSRFKEIEELIESLSLLKQSAPLIFSKKIEELEDGLREFQPEYSDLENYTLQLFTAGGSLIWEEGDSAFDYGDYYYSVEEVI